MTIDFTSYKSIKVFHLMPVWTDIKIGISRGTPGSTGSPFAYYSSEFLEENPWYDTNFTYQFSDEEEISEVNDLFDELKGRWGNVWFPDWYNDFKINGDIAADDTTIDVLDTTNFSTFYPSGSGTGRYLFIFVNENTWYIKKITGFDTTSITIDSALGEAHSKESVRFLCFLYAGRLNVDEIVWEYITPDVARISLDFTELSNEYTTTTTTTTTTTSSTTTTTTTTA